MDTATAEEEVTVTDTGNRYEWIIQKKGLDNGGRIAARSM